MSEFSQYDRVRFTGNRTGSIRVNVKDGSEGTVTISDAGLGNAHVLFDAGSHDTERGAVGQYVSSACLEIIGAKAEPKYAHEVGAEVMRTAGVYKGKRGVVRSRRVSPSGRVNYYTVQIYGVLAYRTYNESELEPYVAPEPHKYAIGDKVMTAVGFRAGERLTIIEYRPAGINGPRYLLQTDAGIRIITSEPRLVPYVPPALKVNDVVESREDLDNIKAGTVIIDKDNEVLRRVMRNGAPKWQSFTGSEYSDPYPTYPLKVAALSTMI